MKRVFLAVVLASIAVGCDDSTTAPATVNPTFTAQMFPANETTAVGGGERTSPEPSQLPL